LAVIKNKRQSAYSPLTIKKQREPAKVTGGDAKHTTLTEEGLLLKLIEGELLSIFQTIFKIKKTYLERMSLSNAILTFK